MLLGRAAAAAEGPLRVWRLDCFQLPIATIFKGHYSLCHRFLQLMILATCRTHCPGRTPGAATVVLFYYCVEHIIMLHYSQQLAVIHRIRQGNQVQAGESRSGGGLHSHHQASCPCTQQPSRQPAQPDSSLTAAHLTCRQGSASQQARLKSSAFAVPPAQARIRLTGASQQAHSRPGSEQGLDVGLDGQRCSGAAVALHHLAAAVHQELAAIE